MKQKVAGDLGKKISLVWLAAQGEEGGRHGLQVPVLGPFLTKRFLPLVL